ncbi:hypothetical protein F4604DRAFT_1724618 [Suillus subluteus]|nr:hypothetical protein F4604DRAFT_1724618 [Suillus subluteus]
MVIRPGSYKHHITTAKHIGHKLTLFKCPLCPKTYTRRDASKRHWDERCGKLAADGARLSYKAACQRFMSSASASPETMSTEVTEDAPNPDTCAANGTQDLALVHGNRVFWRWINGIEDSVDPVLPISEPPSSPPAEDPDVWSLVNEIEDFVDP